MSFYNVLFVFSFNRYKRVLRGFESEISTYTVFATCISAGGRSFNWLTELIHLAAFLQTLCKCRINISLFNELYHLEGKFRSAASLDFNVVTAVIFPATLFSQNRRI